MNSCLPTQSEANASFDAALAASGYSDGCGGAVTAELVSAVVSGNKCSWSILYTFKVKDECGNTLNGQSYTRSGSDQSAPTGSAPAAITGVNACLPTQSEANASFDAALAASGYSDGCGGTVTAELVSAVVSGSKCSWSISYTFKVKDECGNALNGQSYTRSGSDQSAPTGSAPAAITGVNACLPTQSEADASFDAALAASGYSDGCGGTVTAQLVSANILSGSSNCNWRVNYTFKVKDECGNELTGQSYQRSGSCPWPILDLTLNGLNIFNNYDGIDDSGVIAICNSVSNNLLFTKFEEKSGVPPSDKLKIIQQFTSTNVNSIFVNGILPLSSFSAPFSANISLINPNIAGSLVMRYRIFYDSDNNNILDVNECTNDWIVYTINVNPLPTVNLTGNSLVCKNSSIDVQGNPTGGSGMYSIHNWLQIGGAGSVSIVNHLDGTATITGTMEGIVNLYYEVTDQNGCTGSGVKNITVTDCGSVSFKITDPCSCNNDQTSNGAQDGTFKENVSVSPTTGAQTWTVIAIGRLAPAGGLPSGISVGNTLTYNAGGYHEINFKHVDDAGYTVIVEGPNPLTGSPGSPAMGNVQFTASNICQYPVIAFSPALPDNVCYKSTPINLVVSEENGFAGTASFTVNGLPASVFDPSPPLTPPGPYPVTSDFTGSFVNNISTDVNHPAFPGCMTSISDQVGISPPPMLICPPSFNTTTSGDDLGDCDIKQLINYPSIGTLCMTTLEIGFSKSVPEPASLPPGGIVLPSTTGMYAFSAGKTIITYTATDASNNTSSCSFCITVADDENPSIICPSDLTVNCEQGIDPSVTGNPIVHDNCTSMVTDIVQSDVRMSGSCPYNFILTRTWTATDSSGNYGQCVQTITVQDTTRPIISCPSNKLLDCPADTTTMVTGIAVAMDACTLKTSVSYSDVSVTGCAGTYSTTRTWTATDSCGNQNSCQQNINVQDTTRPTISCPSDVTLNCPADTTTANTGVATASDACTIGTAITYRDASVAGCGNTYATTRIWTATDACNNVNSCAQIITVQDTTRPTISCPSDVTLNCPADTATANTGLATANDVCTTGPAITYHDASVAGCGNAYITTRTFVASDACGNTNACTQVITVQDTTRPSISCPSDVTLNCPADTTTTNTGLATAQDACTAVLSLTYNDASVNGCNHTFTTTRTWKATDACGNMNTCVQIINVQDTSGPLISCPVNRTVGCYNDTSILNTGRPMVTDACSGGIASYNWRDVITDSTCIGMFNVHRYFSAVDACGNRSQCEQIITVRDSVKPVAICRNLQFVYSTDHFVVITADSVNNGSYDNCSSEVLISIDKDTIYCNRGLSTDYVTLTVRDSCGNADTCIAEITLIDNTDPVINCPGDLQVQLSECGCFANLTSPGGPLAGGITATDNCDTSVQIIQLSPLGIPLDSVPPGTHTFVFAALDDFGNSDTCTFNVTVAGTSSSTISCRSQINVSVDGSCHATVTGLSLVTGSSCPENSFKVVLYDENHHQLNSNIVDASFIGKKITARVSYLCAGNSCWSTVLIEDKLPPVLICKPDTIDCGDTSRLDLVQEVFENCGPVTISELDHKRVQVACNQDIIAYDIRTYQAKDKYGNLSKICDDTSYVRRVKLDSIVLDSMTLHYSCSSGYVPDQQGNPTPDRKTMPTYHGKPLLSNYECNIHVKYTDIVISTDRCKKKIIRNWAIYEWWCNQEFTRTFNQLISIVDDVAPVITTSDIQLETVETGTPDCKLKFRIPTIEAKDLCSGVDHISLFVDGAEVPYLPGNYQDILYGSHVLSFVVFDYCGNSDTLTKAVRFEDKLIPTVICKANTVITMNSGTTVSLPAKSLDNGSYDQCGPVTLEGRRMDVISCGSTDWSTELVYCCDDIGRTNMAALKVTDQSGNTGICMVNVIVQDKSKPVIQGLPDLEVDCRLGYEIAHLDKTFGKLALTESERKNIVIDPKYLFQVTGVLRDGLATDNCSVIITETVDTSGLNSCKLGRIVRKFVVRDKFGNTDSVYQKIVIANHFPLTLSNIEWPRDLDTANVCDPNNLRPEFLKSPYNVPVIRDGVCSQVGISHDDHIFYTSNASAGCYKILREWKITDWCYRDSGNSFVIFSDTQVIKVNNRIAPTIIKQCADTTVCSFDSICGPVSLSLSISAVDFCGANSDLIYRYKLDFNGDGVIDLVKSQIGDPVASGSWPLGRHLMNWEVEDRCGNISKCRSQVNLLNCKPPTAYAFKEFNIKLHGEDTNGDQVPDKKLGELWASDLNAGSKHGCGYYITFSFSRDTNDKKRVFTCDSIGDRTVELWVTDINGNASVVKTVIHVEDDPNQLPVCPKKLTSNVLGQITSPSREEVESVEVELQNSGLAKSLTNHVGEYAFLDMPVGGDYVVKPYKNDDWLNGVTTADIVEIQKYILGKKEITDPYKMIAADVNNSKYVSSADISELRKLILGITTDVKKNTSWRFISKDYQMVSADNILKENLPEQYDIRSLQADVKADFTAIKIGDLTGNAKTKGINGGVIIRTSEVMDLSFEEIYLKKGDEYEVHFYSGNLNEFAGLQTTLVSRRDKVEILSVSGNDALNLGPEHFNLNELPGGLFSVSWNATHEATDNRLFSIKIKALSGGWLSEYLRLSNDITQTLGVSPSGKECSLQLRHFNSNPTEFAILQNEPNPWKSTTSIGMILPVSGIAQLTVFDATGLVVLQTERWFEKGTGQWVLNKSDLKGSGIFFYQVNFGNQNKSGKMILIE
ncbi:MAG TPA: T9SS type A sorting domain-containing protein [Saprospiraceae bacterium]|nr:T9SS type A sorting domain-containing protein [Saprospiraceae bacterium]HNG69172.1 T9SS type A sorting domain-containing protein [Saprospiraceae bacterium]HNJ54047.1 T9SS type A sorting domain-containing protein [Saprospiraceae bacterium]